MYEGKLHHFLVFVDYEIWRMGFYEGILGLVTFFWKLTYSALSSAAAGAAATVGPQ